MYRCMECGAFWGEHQPTCTRCFLSGYILPWSERPRAALDGTIGVSNAREVTSRMFRQIEQSAYEDLELGYSALVMVSGRPGMGKSSMASLLVNGVKGPCLSINAEEGIAQSYAARLRRLGIKRADFHIVTRASVDIAVSYARKVGARAVLIDSVQEACWSANELRHMLEVVPEIGLLVAVMQVTKAGLPAGSNALIHECDVHIVVEQMTWTLRKSRFQQISNVGGPVLPPHVNFTGESKEER